MLSKKSLDEAKFVAALRQQAEHTVPSSYTGHGVCVLDTRDINCWDGQKLIDSIIDWSKRLGTGEKTQLSYGVGFSVEWG